VLHLVKYGVKKPSKKRGQNKMTIKKDSYYYSAEEWSRSIGYGEVPPERLKPMEQLELFPELKPSQPNPWLHIKDNIE
jgi:hypothetical protein